MRAAAAHHPSSLLLAAACALAGCEGRPEQPPAGAGEPRRGGTAVLGTVVDVDNWNEYLSQQAFANALHRRLYPRLAREAPPEPGQPPRFEPELAEAWSFSEDRLALTFRLREASWSDGNPIQASDVRFTWRAQTSPEVGWINASTKEHIREVEARDPRTVVFHFDRAYPEQLADAVTGGVLPEHIFARVPFARWRTHDWSSVRVVSGPFRLAAYRPAEEIVLERNPGYYRAELPRLDRVVFRIVPDISNLLTQLLAGHLDYVDKLPPWEAARLERSGPVRIVEFRVPGFEYIGWNHRREPFDDPRVRRALTLAIDRQGLVDELLRGYGTVCAGPVPSWSAAADPALEPWPHDPGEAERLLREAGFARDSEGRLVRGGRPLALTLATNAGNRLREAVLVKVQEQLRRLGIEVQVASLEMAAFRERNAAGDFDAYVGGWTISGRALRQLFHSQMLPPRGANIVAYRSPRADALLERLDAAKTWEQALPVLRELQRCLHEEQPYTFLYEMPLLAAVAARLQGVSPGPPDDPLAHLEQAWIAVP